MKELTNIGSIASIIGLIISIITMIVAYIINNKVKKMQNSNVFDKTIDKHLKTINELQNEFNLILPNVKKSEKRIKEILVKHISLFESIYPYLHESIAKKKTRQMIEKINKSKYKSFYDYANYSINLKTVVLLWYKKTILNMISSQDLLNLYTLINENYNRILQVKLIKKAKL